MLVIRVSGYDNLFLEERGKQFIWIKIGGVHWMGSGDRRSFAPHHVNIRLVVLEPLWRRFAGASHNDIVSSVSISFDVLAVESFRVIIPPFDDDIRVIFGDEKITADRPDCYMDRCPVKDGMTTAFL